MYLYTFGYIQDAAGYIRRYFEMYPGLSQNQQIQRMYSEP